MTYAWVEARQPTSGLQLQPVEQADTRCHHNGAVSSEEPGWKSHHYLSWPIRPS